MSYDTNLRAAVRDLIAAKGRYHTGIEYARLVAAFNAQELEFVMPVVTVSKETIEAMYPRLTNPTTKQSLAAPDPRYDARCALQEKTDWSAS
jgi:hypothetical protein